MSLRKIIEEEIEEISDDDFESVIRENRHREILSIFKQLLKEVKNIDLSDAVEANNKAIETFLKKLKEISAPELNQKEVVAEVKTLIEKTTEVKNVIAQKEWVFEVTKRDANGRIATVSAKPK